MKKINLAVVGLVTLGVLGLGQTANAAENQVGETTAAVEVKAGPLTIKDFPKDIKFGDVYINGGSMKAEENKASITIEDFRGSSSKGWVLNASLKGEKDFKGMQVTLSPMVTSNKDVAKPTKQILNDKGQPIATVADADITQTEFDTSMTLNAKLDIPADQKAATYNTTIVWNLAEGPGTEA